MPVKLADGQLLHTPARRAANQPIVDHTTAIDGPAIDVALQTFIGSLGLVPIEGAFETVDGTETLLRFELDGFQYALVRSHLARLAHLSAREKEIVRLVACGLPNKCIASTLDISIWTVATHLRRIFAKLGVTTRAAMIARVASIDALAQDRPSQRQSSAKNSGVGRQAHAPVGHQGPSTDRV
jgi:DNA-binding CsgD family transcriptional regulator